MLNKTMVRNLLKRAEEKKIFSEEIKNSINWVNGNTYNPPSNVYDMVNHKKLQAEFPFDTGSLQNLIIRLCNIIIPIYCSSSRRKKKKICQYASWFMCYPLLGNTV